MVIDIGYLKKVTKRITMFALSLVRYIPSIQNGSILYAIFDCVHNISNGRTANQIYIQKNKNAKKTKRSNSNNRSICHYSKPIGLGNSSINRRRSKPPKDAKRIRRERIWIYNEPNRQAKLWRNTNLRRSTKHNKKLSSKPPRPNIKMGIRLYNINPNSGHTNRNSSEYTQ